MKGALITLAIILCIAAVPKLTDLSQQQALNIIAKRNLESVCHGAKLPGVECIDKFGYNKDIDIAASETVWPAGGKYVYPTGAETLSIVSADADDTITGTGARILQIVGLDANYDEQVEVINLTGTVATTTVNSFIAVNRAVVISAGSSRFNEGPIDITQSSSGIVFGKILHGISITEQLVYTVPNGKQLYLIEADISGTKTGGGTNPLLTFEIRYFDPNLSTTLDATTSGVIINAYEDQIDTAVSNHRDEGFVLAGAIREHSTVSVRVETDKDNTVVHGRFVGILVDTE